MEQKLWAAIGIGAAVWFFQFCITDAVAQRAGREEIKSMDSLYPSVAPGHARAWQLIYVRDICKVVKVGHGLTNALLAAILTTLIVS